ncbi:unnamed protein product [Clonostachys solani]|uniref:Uncharacterized protein n=1 Tax=Clonostachys solani TaxID=160281 RepID=A0A9N9Z0S6_9HYPO|nr:unnamed protein product [Clonostachys solani]
MGSYHLPVWGHITLLVLTILAFAPHLYFLARKQDSSPVSIVYILLNLVVATEQFAVSYFFAIYPTNTKCLICPTYKDIFSHTPLDVGDWLNFVHFLTVFVLWLIMCKFPPTPSEQLLTDASFTLCLRYRLAQNREELTVLVRRPGWIYSWFLLLTIGPLVVETAFGGIDYRGRTSPILFVYQFPHIFLLAPLMPVIQAIAIVAQLRRDRETRNRAPVCIQGGLVAQTIIFCLLAVTWPYRLLLDDTNWSLLSWYTFAGWISISSGIFAFGQGLLLFYARGVCRAEGHDAGEGRALLHDAPSEHTNETDGSQ